MAVWRLAPRELASAVDVIKSGALPVASITARHTYALREPYANTPVRANQLVSMLRTLIAFGIPRGDIDRHLASRSRLFRSLT
jgi:hypothetical protein